MSECPGALQRRTFLSLSPDVLPAWSFFNPIWAVSLRRVQPFFNLSLTYWTSITGGGGIYSGGGGGGGGGVSCGGGG